MTKGLAQLNSVQFTLLRFATHTIKDTLLEWKEGEKKRKEKKEKEEKEKRNNCAN